MTKKRPGDFPRKFDPLQVQVGIRIRAKKGKPIRLTKEALNELIGMWADDPDSLPRQVEVYAVWWKNPTRKNAALAKWKVATQDKRAAAKIMENGRPAQDTGETPEYASGTLNLGRLLSSGIVDIRPLGPPSTWAPPRSHSNRHRQAKAAKPTKGKLPAKNNEPEAKASRIPKNEKRMASSDNAKPKTKPGRNRSSTGDTRK